VNIDNRKAFKEHQARVREDQAKNGPKRPQREHQIIQLRQAAVKSNWLLNDPKWDTFLTWVQADVEELEKMEAHARAKLENPAITNHDELMKAKIVLLEAQAMKRALTIAITYPRKILDDKIALEDRKKDLTSDED